MKKKKNQLFFIFNFYIDFITNENIQKEWIFFYFSFLWLPLPRRE